MDRNIKRFRTASTISCCHHCVPPKRHTACWDHCPEYQKEKAEYEAMKAERAKKIQLERMLNAQIHDSVNRARKRHK